MHSFFTERIHFFFLQDSTHVYPLKQSSAGDLDDIVDMVQRMCLSEEMDWVRVHIEPLTVGLQQHTQPHQTPDH